MRCTASSCWFYSGVCGADSCSKPTAGRATIYATTPFLKGSQVNRVAFDSALNSGIRSEFPEAWAVILKGSAGILASWMDRDFANGKAENVAPDQPLISGGGVGNSKIYQRAWRSFGSSGAFPDLLLTPASEYAWRGGYAIQADNGDGTFDCTLKLKDLSSVINGDMYF